MYMLREWLLLVSGKYFVMRLIGTTMKNWLLSDNYWNEMLLVASIILLQLTPGRRKNNHTLWGWWLRDCFYLPLHYFSGPSVVTQRVGLFMTLLSTLIHQRTILCQYLLLFCSILIKKRLLEVTETYGCLMVRYSSGESFGFTMVVLSSTRKPNTVNTWVVTSFKLNLTPSFITVGLFTLVFLLISSLLFDSLVPKND